MPVAIAQHYQPASIQELPADSMNASEVFLPVCLSGNERGRTLHVRVDYATK